MRPSVLFVEDEEALRMTVGDRLRSEGYIVDFAVDGDEGLEKATQLPFDLIILDIMLPHRDGLSICRDLRDAGLITPLLMLTARGQTDDKILGLKTGADDYVTKPFDMPELVARIEALLRRAPTGSPAHRGVYQFATIRVDRRATEVTRDGKPVNLSVREFQLLKYLIEHAGVTVSREQLLIDVWGYNGKIFTRTVDVHIASLRQKLEADHRHPAFIQTVQRVGYKFTPEVVVS
jgi:two-component system alkaline phosphatase synthesis response regulator PhoP